MKSFFILISTILFLSTFIIGQSLSEKLIQQKAKELGVSESSLKKKATEYGYDLTNNNVQDASEKKTPLVIEKKISSINKSIQNYNVSGFGVPAFGYDIFKYKPETFEPGLNIPVPKNYVLGPGDEIIISLWGETQLVNNFVVSKEGTIYLKSSGVININGLNLEEVKDKLFKILSKTYSTLASQIADNMTYMEITTGFLRTVKVFCLGEVVQPGGYSLPSLSTLFTGLYYSGGPKINGSLREVKVIREGKEVVRMDLYNYLLSGIKKNDISLQEGDVIYIDQVGKRVAIEGDIFRPAVYELFSNEKLKDLFKYAGGISFNTYIKRLSVERIIPFSQRKLHDKNKIVIDLNFTSKEDFLNSDFELEDGDIVKVFSINTLFENKVSIIGAVNKPGTFELTAGMRVADLIKNADLLKDNVFVEQAVLFRTLPNEKKEMLTFNLEKALLLNPTENLILMDRDEIQIYMHERFFPTRSVQITGEVNKPATYTRFEKMTIKDLITLAGGFTFSADLNTIEVSRLDTTKIENYYKNYYFKFNSEYWNSEIGEDFILQDFDKISVKSDPKIKMGEFINISGEVKYPGSYSILKKGDKITDFVKRAGGLLNTAYIDGIYIERNNNYKMEINTKLKSMADSLSLASGSNIEADLSEKRFLSQFADQIPVDWKLIQNGDYTYNYELFPGDRIVIPQDENVVYVMGEVAIQSFIPFRIGADIDYYIRQAGGLTKNSLENRIIVMLPGGKKWESGGLFRSADEILSGSKIFVPMEIKVERSNWEYARDITAIVTSGAVLILTIQNISK
jgi:protein involved in polysaccharide export with SLBB domain